MKNLFFRICLGLLVFTWSACLDGKDLHGDKQDDNEEQSVEYRTITVSITSDRDGVLCQLYQTYPFDEKGNLITSPCLKAYTPVSSYVQIPTTVKTLYVLVDKNKIYESDATEVSLHIK